MHLLPYHRLTSVAWLPLP